MDKVKRSIRLPIPVANAVQKQAALRGVSQYAMLEMCVHQGLSKIANEDNSGKILNDIALETGSLKSILNLQTKLLERAIYIATASYTYARLSTSNLRLDEKLIKEQIQSTFNRNINLVYGAHDDHE